MKVKKWYQKIEPIKCYFIKIITHLQHISFQKVAKDAQISTKGILVGQFVILEHGRMKKILTMVIVTDQYALMVVS